MSLWRPSFLFSLFSPSNLSPLPRAKRDQKIQALEKLKEYVRSQEIQITSVKQRKEDLLLGFEARKEAAATSATVLDDLKSDPFASLPFFEGLK